MAVAGELVQAKIDKLLTQYRESPKLIGEIELNLRQIEEVYNAIACIPESFNLDTAVGDQLEIIGRRLGFGKTHCVCTSQPFYGFNCDNSNQTVAGFCDDSATWSGCGTTGFGEVTINSDETYRRLLKSRAIQARSLFDIQSLCNAIQILWGDQARVLSDSNKRIVIGIGRDLTNEEIALLQVYPRVLPVALGVSIRFHFGAIDRLAGFGDGWSGFCSGSEEQTLSLVDQDGNQITDQNGIYLITETSTGSEETSWVCAIDVAPYGCNDGVNLNG